MIYTNENETYITENEYIPPERLREIAKEQTDNKKHKTDGQHFDETLKAIDKDIIIQILEKLIGEVRPYGCEARDEIRLRNLDVAIGVADWLLDLIEDAAGFHNRPEASIKQIGERAYIWLEDVADTFSEGYIDVVRCRECKWYEKPHIKYNNGTKKYFDSETEVEFVTADIGSNIGGQCVGHKTYCTAHDRENPEDYEELVVFRNTDDYCSYGERKESDTE